MALACFPGLVVGFELGNPTGDSSSRFRRRSRSPVFMRLSSTRHWAGLDGSWRNVPRSEAVAGAGRSRLAICWLAVPARAATVRQGTGAARPSAHQATARHPAPGAISKALYVWYRTPGGRRSAGRRGTEVESFSAELTGLATPPRCIVGHLQGVPPGGAWRPAQDRSVGDCRRRRHDLLDLTGSG